jgi:hypothetical protein
VGPGVGGAFGVADASGVGDAFGVADAFGVGVASTGAAETGSTAADGGATGVAKCETLGLDDDAQPATSTMDAQSAASRAKAPGPRSIERATRAARVRSVRPSSAGR